ncbi:MAG: phosphatase PAP2 family protein [Zoogloeaceae bacterium]|nr:phosphatase PAP2 family protein [Zoogloeaceae bacterium]
METVSASTWYRQLGRRFRVLWPLKAVGTMGFLALFFWAYFAVLRHPLTEPMLMPLIGLDTLIPFSPSAYPFYVSLWVYVSLPPAFLGSWRSLWQFGAWIAALCLFCLIIFWLFPTTIPAADIDWSLYPDLAVIKGLDAGGNAFPSLHVASAVFAAYWLDRLLQQVGAPALLRWLSALQCLLILWSTVATRQHVVLDVLAGVLVGGVFAVVSYVRVRRAAGVEVL